MEPQRSPPISIAEVPSASAQAAEPPAETKPEQGADEPPAGSPEATALAACMKDSKLSHCAPLFDGDVDAMERDSFRQGTFCTTGCIKGYEDRNALMVKAGYEACLAAYVAARGKKPAKCTIPIAKRPSDARLVSMRFQDALRAAVEKGDAKSLAALDAMLPVLDAKHLKGIAAECDERCRQFGDERLVAPKH